MNGANARTTITIAATFAAAIAVSLLLAPSRASAEPLDGEVYDVKISEADKAPIADRLTFGGGLFESVECIQYGFAKAAYTATLLGDAVVFEATAASPGEGTTTWKGVVQGDAISGNMLWELEGKGAAAYTFAGTVVPRAKHALDGKTFDVAVAPEKGKADPDVLIFERGVFRSTACDPYGFFECAYMSEVAAGTGIRFTATAKSPKEGTTSWQGQVKGIKIDGTMTWAKEGQPAATYTFSGFLRNPAAKAANGAQK